jgi:hypothetical protein
MMIMKKLKSNRRNYLTWMDVSNSLVHVHPLNFVELFKVVWLNALSDINAAGAALPTRATRHVVNSDDEMS